jgi:magnesium transporter
MCLLFAKSGVELLLLTVGGDNQFWRWQAWLLILGLSAFALLQLWYLHKALILANPTLVCPRALHPHLTWTLFFIAHVGV